MARTFQNPANKHEETIGASSSLAAFFLGLIYLAYKGLWIHVFIWLLVVVAPSTASGAPTFVLTLPLASIFYGLAIQQILAARYLQRGWLEVTTASADADDDLAAATSLLLATPDPMKPRPSLVSPTTAGPTKICPFCAEEVRAAAVKCKHCQSELPVNDAHRKNSSATHS